MTETMTIADLIKDFGAGWVRVSRLTGSFVEQNLRYKERHLEEDGSVTCRERSSTYFYDTRQDAFKASLDEEKGRLAKDIREKGDAIEKMKRYLGWYGAVRGWPLLRRKELKQGLDLLNQALEADMDAWESLPDSIVVHPLPDSIEHHGRLPLGSSVWCLDWDDPKNGYPLFECVLVMEKVYLACRGVLNPKGPSSFTYDMQPVGDLVRDYGPLCLNIDAEGINARPRYGLSVFQTKAEAVAARRECVDQLQAAVRRFDDVVVKFWS